MMDRSVAVVTFRVAEPIMVPEVAVIVTAPVLTPVARPAALMSAKVPLDDVQTTCEVMSCVLLSENTPVAVNWTLPLIPTTVVTGVTTIFVRTADETVS